MKRLHRPHSASRAAAWLLALASGCIAGQASAQASAAEIERGRQLFMTNGCYACHGTVGQGGERGAGPRIAPQPRPLETFKALVRTPAEAMPRFDPRFVSDEQLQAIHAYLSAIPKGPSAKDIPLLRD